MTNFRFEVSAYVSSESSFQKLKLKGTLFKLTFQQGQILDFYMPDSKVHSAVQFKTLFDAQFLKPKMHIKCSEKQWSEFVTKEIQTFEGSTRFKEMEFMEYIGLQVHTFKPEGRFKIF